MRRAVSLCYSIEETVVRTGRCARAGGAACEEEEDPAGAYSYRQFQRALGLVKDIVVGGQRSLSCPLLLSRNPD